FLAAFGGVNVARPPARSRRPGRSSTASQRQANQRRPLPQGLCLSGSTGAQPPARWLPTWLSRINPGLHGTCWVAVRQRAATRRLSASHPPPTDFVVLTRKVVGETVEACWTWR